MKKRFMAIAFLALLVGGFVFVSMGVNAASVYDSLGYNELEVTEDGTYTLEDMLTYAIKDEYMAYATYAAIIEAYGEVRPFTRVILAEQTHIELLLPLFETYGIEVPENDAAAYVVLPDSISSALSTGVEAETVNIALYQTFLSDETLPDDVKTVFEQLVAASENHLAAFSRARYIGAGYDLAQQAQKRFGKMFKKQTQNLTGDCTQS